MDFDVPDYWSETKVKMKIIRRSSPSNSNVVLHEKTITLGVLFSATGNKKWEKDDHEDDNRLQEVFGWTSLKIRSSTQARKQHKYDGDFIPFTSCRKKNNEKFYSMLSRISIPRKIPEEQDSDKSYWKSLLSKNNRKQYETNWNTSDEKVETCVHFVDFFFRVRYSRTVDLLTLQNLESFYQHNSSEFKKIRCETDLAKFKKYGDIISPLIHSREGLDQRVEEVKKNYQLSEFHFLILHGNVKLVSRIMIDLSKKKMLRAALLRTDSCGRNALDIALYEGEMNKDVPTFCDLLEAYLTNI